MAELTFFTLGGVVTAVDGQRDAGDPTSVATYGALTVTALSSPAPHNTMGLSE
jgi:hypothetical protein